MLAAPVFCDPDRFRGGQAAIAAGHDCCVLDDGFQHRRLHRDLDLVCMDATRPLGHLGHGVTQTLGKNATARARTLPLGLLREAPFALRRADAVIGNRWQQGAERVSRSSPPALSAISCPCCGRTTSRARCDDCMRGLAIGAPGW